MYKEIETLYKKINKLAITDATNVGITNLFFELYLLCSKFLDSIEQVEIVSKIPEKEYFAFFFNNKASRSVNIDLYVGPEEITHVIQCITMNNLDRTSSDQITKALYTMAISFCCVVDLHKKGDQKTPGTFFEYFASHWFARALNIHPKKSVEVLNLDMRTSLPTDFTFDLGPGRPKIHLPVKTSTRERAIQVWAHQRVLDGVYGTGRFLGMLVALSETKTDTTKRVITDICLPDQWRVYQLFVAQMHRMYYLDVPGKYLNLDAIFPPIVVKPFGDFFYEIKNIIA